MFKPLQCGSSARVGQVLLLAAVFVCGGVAARAADGGLTWARGFTLPRTHTPVLVARDGANNCGALVCTDTGGDFDPGPGVAWLSGPDFTSEGGGDNVFVVKMNPLGQYVWAKHIGGPFENALGFRAFTMDEPGNFYGVVAFWPEAEIHLGSNVSSCGSDGQNDIWDENVFLFKLDPAGNVMWVRRLAPIQARQDRNFSPTYAVSRLVVDRNGNVLMSGWFIGTRDFDPGPGTAMLTHAGIEGEDYLVKFDADGNFLWVKAFPNWLCLDYATLAVDESNNVYFAANRDTPSGLRPFSIWKLDASGNELWQKNVAVEMLTGYTVNGNGESLAWGRFEGAVDVDPGPDVTTLTADAESAAFVLRLDPSGNFRWAKRLNLPRGTDFLIQYDNFHVGTYDNSWSQSFKLDDTGNVIGAGKFRGTVDLDPGPGIANLTTGSTVPNSTAVFVLKLDSLGNLVWAHRIAGSGHEDLMSLAVNERGYAWVTGRFAGSLNYGQGSRLLTGSRREYESFFVMQVAGTLGVGISGSMADPIMANPIPVTVTFDEHVTGFLESDIVATNATVVHFAGSGAVYTFDLVPGAEGAVTVDIPAGVAQSLDGIANTAAAQFRRQYIRDTDGDGLEDTLETQLGTDPLNADPDHDGLSDREEVGWDGVQRDYVPGADCDPFNPDTDGDGVADGREVEFDHDPLDPADVPILPMAAWPLGLVLLLVGVTRIRRLTERPKY